MTIGFVDVDKIVMQAEWDEDRDNRRFGSSNPLDADEIEVPLEEIINEAY